MLAEAIGVTSEDSNPVTVCQKFGDESAADVAGRTRD
jgi:hypothetical protein